MTKPLLPDAWEVPDVFRRRLGSKVGRQRAMVHEGHLLLVLHAAPTSDETERRGRFFWRDPEGDWTSSDLGGGAAAVKKHIDEYSTALELLDDRCDAAQRPHEYFGIIREVIPLQHAANNLFTTLQEARQALPQYTDIIDLRDRAYTTQRAAEFLYTVAKEGLDFEIAQQSEEMTTHGYEMSVSAHRLNMLAAFFFPLVTISSILGMNLSHDLDVAPPLPFWSVIGVGLLVGTVLTLLIAAVGRPKARASSPPPPSG